MTLADGRRSPWSLDKQDDVHTYGSKKSGTIAVGVLLPTTVFQMIRTVKGKKLRLP